MTVYYHVDDIKKSLKSLVDAGAKLVASMINAGLIDEIRLMINPLLYKR